MFLAAVNTPSTAEVSPKTGTGKEYVTTLSGKSAELPSADSISAK
jgi:hypothetical protein